MDTSERTTLFETTLSNGLGVILKEDRSAPIASVWTWYRVGSRNEIPGITGISHWVEHMQFKGTPSIAKGQIFRDVSRVGGTLNALTSHDWTAYFETLPVEHIDLALAIESDRMVNSIFDPEEVESERTVILSERQGSENNPAYQLYEEVTGTAFRAHPYRHMVIGYESDLRRITREDLYAHYRHYYHPANAFIVAVGDFDAGHLLSQIEARFGQIPAGDNVPRKIASSEPPQAGERRVLLHQPSGAPYFRMAFHAPAAAGDDLVPLLVAEAILSGGKAMGLGGGGAMGRSSRLYRSLVASGMARAAGSDMSISLDPFLFQIGVVGLPDSDLDAIEQTIEAELARLRETPAGPDEMARALRQLESQFVYSSEGVTNQAYWLGLWHIVDRWPRALALPDEIRAVSADDVQRAAQRYLLPDRRTIGWLVPSEPGPDDEPTGASSQAAFTGQIAWGLTGPCAVGPPGSHGFQQAVLSNGIPVLAQDRPDSRSVTIRLRLAAGSIWETEKDAGIAHLAARAAIRGSGGMTFDEINARTDALGSSLSVDAGKEFVEARVRCLRDDLEEMVNLLAQTVRVPDYPEGEIERVRAEQIGAIAESDNDTRATADRLLRRAVYPTPNPLGRRVLGNAGRVLELDAHTVRNFHAAMYGSDHAAVAMVGGIGGFDRAVEMLASAFGDWQSAPGRTRPPDLTRTNDQEARVDSAIQGKSQADLALGLATISRTNADFYALDIANLILGRLGLMGRLGAEVRDRHGLAYYAFSQLEPRKDGSLWSARAGVDPDNIERAVDAIRGELDRLRQTPVTDDELRDARSYLIGVVPLALESHDGVAATLLAIQEFGLGLDFLERYPGIIAGVTREDVLAAAQTHLDPTRLAISIARPA